MNYISDLSIICSIVQRKKPILIKSSFQFLCAMLEFCIFFYVSLFINTLCLDTLESLCSSIEFKTFLLIIELI